MSRDAYIRGPAPEDETSTAVKPHTRRKAGVRKKVPLGQSVRDWRDRTLRRIGTFTVIVAMGALSVMFLVGYTKTLTVKAEQAQAQRFAEQTKYQQVAFTQENRMTEALAYDDPGKRPASTKARRRTSR